MSNRPALSVGDLPTSAGDVPPPTATFANIAPPGYDLLGEVGRGGMGMVFRARDSELDREVAVKLLADRYPAGSVTARRFVDEARITARLQHPGIPAVYRVGELADGRPFLAMKLIQGQTLADRLAGGGPLDRLAVFEAVCQAVGYAHSKGVVHRDLKPANVMVGAFGEVQVMDWGLAKVVTAVGREAESAEPSAGAAPDAGLTRTGAVLGTPAYLAPEQARGEPVDARADVFGLGAVLCALLTGKPPFAGDTGDGAVVAAARGDTAAAVARLKECGADPEVVALCGRCLAADAADRPASGAAVAAEVAALRAAADDRARQAERDKLAAEVRAGEERKRRRVRVLASGLSLGVAVVSAVLVGLWVWQNNDFLAQRPKLMQRAKDAEAEADWYKLNARTAWFEADVTLSHLIGMVNDHLTARSELNSSDRELIRRVQEVRFMVVNIRSNLGNTPARERDNVHTPSSRHPQAGTFHKLKADAYEWEAELWQRAGESANAEAAMRAAVTARKADVSFEPNSSDEHEFRHRRLAYAHTRLGEVLKLTGKLSDAEAEYRAAVDVERLESTFAYSRLPSVRLAAADAHNCLAGFLWSTDPITGEAEYRLVGNRLEKLAHDQVGDPDHGLLLGGSLCNYAHRLRSAGRPADSLGWYARSIDTLSAVQTPTGERFLRDSLYGRAEALTALARPAEAAADWDRAVDLCTPDDAAQFRAARATFLARTGQVKRAVAEAADLERTADGSGAGWYRVACVYAAAKREEHAVRAVELLRRAFAAGFRDLTFVHRDADLDPLRDRPDFRRLLATLPEQAPPPRPAR